MGRMVNFANTIAQSIGSLFGGLVEQGANLIGVGGTLRDQLGLKQDDELLQLKADIEKIRNSRQSRIDKIQNLIDLFNGYNLTVPGAAMQALAKTKQNLVNKKIQLRNEDSVLRIYEDNVINKADKSNIPMSDYFNKGMAGINKEINQEKEKLYGLQQKFQEERLQ